MTFDDDLAFFEANRARLLASHPMQFALIRERTEACESPAMYSACAS